MEKPTNPIRYAHFHAGTVLTDTATGTVRTGKGRLIATVATQELPDGTLAVGVSRCRVGDLPTRFTGRQIAAARMNRLFKAAQGETLRGTQQELLTKERQELLVFRMRREDFVSKVIQGNLFQRLAAAKGETECNSITQEIRALMQ